MTFLHMTKILEKVGIKQPHLLVTKIGDGGMILYFHDLYKGFKNMEGGAKEAKHFIKYKGIYFTFFKYSLGDAVHYALHPEEDIDNMPQCALIIIDKIEKSATIYTISYHTKKCYSEPQIELFGSKLGGSILLKLSLKLIDEVKDHYNLKYVKLTDKLRKYCDKIENGIDFDSFYMLTRGNTWYGSYGFVPFNISKQKTDSQGLKDYEHNQKIVKETLVKNTNIKKYIIRAVQKYKLDHDVVNIDKYIEKYNDKSVMKCLKDLVTSYDENCAIFYYLYEKLMKDLGMINLHGRTYWKKL